MAEYTNEWIEQREHEMIAYDLLYPGIDNAFNTMILMPGGPIGQLGCILKYLEIEHPDMPKKDSMAVISTAWEIIKFEADTNGK